MRVRVPPGPLLWGVGDLTEVCTVNIDDLFVILGEWGPCELLPLTVSRPKFTMGV